MKLFWTLCAVSLLIGFAVGIAGEDVIKTKPAEINTIAVKKLSQIEIVSPNGSNKLILAAADGGSFIRLVEGNEQQVISFKWIKEIREKNRDRNAAVELREMRIAEIENCINEPRFATYSQATKDSLIAELSRLKSTSVMQQTPTTESAGNFRSTVPTCEPPPGSTGDLLQRK